MRIEFLGYPDTPDEVLGAAYCENLDSPQRVEVVLGQDASPVSGHLTRVAGLVRSNLAEAASALQFGDLISGDFIREFGSNSSAGTPEAACRERLLAAIRDSLLMVARAERYTAADGIPAVRAVIILSVPPDRDTRDALTVVFTAMGWTVEGLAGEREAAVRVYGAQPGRPA
jgi:hypothetical protein